MPTYQVKYQRPKSSNSVTSTTITASSSSQAKEQMKALYNGDVKIISVVER